MYQYVAHLPTTRYVDMAWQGKARKGKARQVKSWHGMAWHGIAWQGLARHGKERHGKAWQVKARHGIARQGKAWRGEARRGNSCNSQFIIFVRAVSAITCTGGKGISRTTVQRFITLFLNKLCECGSLFHVVRTLVVTLYACFCGINTG